MIGKRAMSLAVPVLRSASPSSTLVVQSFLVVEWYARYQLAHNWTAGQIGGPIVAVVFAGEAGPKENGPDEGAIIKRSACDCRPRAVSAARERPFLQAETRQVAVVVRDRGARHQETIDRSHKAAEQRGGGGESDGSGLGHWNSLS